MTDIDRELGRILDNDYDPNNQPTLGSRLPQPRFPGRTMWAIAAGAGVVQAVIVWGYR